MHLTETMITVLNRKLLEKVHVRNQQLLKVAKVNGYGYTEVNV